MKQIIKVIIGISLAGLVFASPKPYKVLISQVVQHPALDATTQGIKDGLAKEGYDLNKNLMLRVESAQANPALAQQIASKYAGASPDVVVGVGTVSAQSLANFANKGRVKLIFSTVTDPIGAGLLKNLTAPGRNTSGVSNFVALSPQLKLFKQLQPNLKRLGVIYNPGEINSVSIIKQLGLVCKQMNLRLVTQVAAKTADVPQAITSLVSKVDAIFISNDNTALSALQNIIKVANKAGMPVYVSDTDAVAQGALAALGPNQYDVGLQTGQMIARVLAGQVVGSMPVEFPANQDLYINLGAAKRLGIKIPEALQQQAAKLIEGEAA